MRKLSPPGVGVSENSPKRYRSSQFQNARYMGSGEYIRFSRMPATYPTRIVCLTEETTETLYLLGEDSRIVGISGFTVRPPRARREKPRVSAFTSAKIDKIVELKPDLVLGFSDLQADIAAELIRAGIEVHVFNHRSVAEILRMIATLGGMVGCEARAAALVARLAAGVDEVRAKAARLPRRPR